MAQSQPGEAQPEIPPGAGSPATGGLLGVDVGGSGIRVGFFDPPSLLRLLISRPDPGAGEQFDPDLTWRAVASAIRELTGRGLPVRAVGLTTHLATVLAGPDGRPTAPAMLWRDNRAWREAAELRARLGPALEFVTGRPTSAEYAAARMRRMARTDPRVVGRTRWLLSLKDYLVLKLTGQPGTDPATASYTQLFDVRQRRWSPRIARECCVPAEILPCVRPGVAPAGGVTPAAAQLTGLAPGTPVAVGGPDGSTGALGAGAVRAGMTVDIAGTTDVLLHVTDRPAGHVGHGTVLNAYLLADLWTMGGPTGLTGGGLEWLAVTLGHASADAAYLALASAMDAVDPGDLMIRTTLSGRRMPGWDERLRGRIDGISWQHGPAHLMRAAEEGSAFEVRLGIDALRSGGAVVDRVILAGGPAGSPRGPQLRANVWDAQVATVVERHASLRGAALVAAVAGGSFTDAQQAAVHMAPRMRSCDPDPAGVAATEHRYRRWRTVMALRRPGGNGKGRKGKRPHTRRRCVAPGRVRPHTRRRCVTPGRVRPLV